MNVATFFSALILAAASAVAQTDFPPQQQETGWVGMGVGQSARFSVLYPSVPIPGGAQVLARATLIIEDADGNTLAAQDVQLTGAKGGRIASVVANSDTAIPVGSRNVQVRAYALVPNVNDPLTPGGGGYITLVFGLDIIDNATGKTVTHVPTQITFPKPAGN